MSKTDKRENIIMVRHTSNLLAPSAYTLITQIASEPLTFEKGRSQVAWKETVNASRSITADWMEIRTNHMVVITPKMNLLQIPIVDKFYVSPSDTTLPARGIEFAAAKGFLSARRSTFPRSLNSIQNRSLWSRDVLGICSIAVIYFM